MLEIHNVRGLASMKVVVMVVVVRVAALTVQPNGRMKVGGISTVDGDSNGSGCGVESVRQKMLNASDCAGEDCRSAS